MKEKKEVSRRSFLKKTSVGVGLGIIGTSSSVFTESVKPLEKEKRLPREVWVATVNLKGLWPERTIEARMKKMLQRMETVVGLRPDIICLPETFNTSWVQEKKSLPEIAEDEDGGGPVIERIAEFAKKYNCYIVCPVITKKDGHFYNSAVLIDRVGSIAGAFHKVHPVKTEIIPKSYYKKGGITPGPLRPPVFKTDFGKVGMQICYDANWFESWEYLKEDGAEIVFFPSQFPGGRILKFHAWKNQYYIVSSTGEDARIIDITGNDIAGSSIFVRYACAPVNLEKVSIPIWPSRDKFPAIHEKYGRTINIKVWNTEGISTIESLDPDVKVRDVLKEFDIMTYKERIKREKEIQDKYRP